MNNFYELEHRCADFFASAPYWWHIWTPESYELVFQNDDDYKAAMFIIGFVAVSFPTVQIVTFQVMSNHLHFTLTGRNNEILEFFQIIRYYLSRYFNKNGRKGILNELDCNYRCIQTLPEARNVVVYNNRNGFLVHPEFSPFTYPWGANSFYFSPMAMKYYEKCKRPFTVRERRSIIHSHSADLLDGVMALDGFAAPPSFCALSLGEGLFRDASHYFNMVSKGIESQKEIAKTIGESIFYTDDELYRIISICCKEKYSQISPALIPAYAKIEMAKMMRFEYNASDKQICRMLKISPSVLAQAIMSLKR